MGSLNNVFSEEEFKKWVSKFQPDMVLSAQPKLDGLSASLKYKDSNLIQAITRGDGTEGEDITDNVKLMRGIIPDKSFSGTIRAEIMLSKQDFCKINSILPEKDRYKNARNAAAGISRRLDGKYCQFLTVMPYDIDIKNGLDIKPLDEDKKITVLKELGFCPPEQVIGLVDKIIWAYKGMMNRRESYPFGIDAVVVKVCDHNTQKTFGNVNNRPRAQIAWKFDPPGAITRLLDVTWEVGRTGVVTPLGHVEAVDIDGSTIKKVTLHNIAEIERLGIGIGDTVMLVKSGDIIPKITSVIEHVNNPIQVPDRCWMCGFFLENDHIKLICKNEGCPGRNFYRIMNWIKVTKIENFGEALADKLFNAGPEREGLFVLKSIYDLYRLTIDDIASVEGWGKKSAKTIVENINKTRTLKPSIFLTALGIPGISYKTAEDLLKAFGTVEGILNAKKNDIKVLKGYSDISSETITTGLKAYSSVIKHLLTVINLTEQKAEGRLSGKSFCFTGAMSQPRNLYQEYVISNGGKNLSTVTKDLDYLVCNEDKGSSKSQKAKKYGIAIITEQQFLDMIDIPIEEKTPDKKIKSVSLFE
jgi:DNA ligase (NAD+)